MRVVRNLCIAVALCTYGALPMLPAAHAAVYTLTTNTTPFTGTGAGSALIFTFNDLSLNTVQMTIDVSALGANDYVIELGFNVNPTIGLVAGNTLSITAASLGSVAAPTINIGPINTQNITSDPLGAGYDVSLTGFSSANSQRFKAAAGNNIIIYNITRTGTNPALSAGDFIFQQTINPRASFAAIALHAGNIGLDVPEPSSLALLGAGLAGLFSRRRRAHPAQKSPNHGVPTMR